MSGVAGLWRYPIKSHGREALVSVDLCEGRTMPWDRHWAVTHEKSKFDATAPEWVMCRNFMIGALTPELAGLSAKLDPDTATVTLRHPTAGDLTVRPDAPEDVAQLISYLSKLCPADGPRPAGIAKVPDRGITDTDYPTVSIMNAASHRTVSGRMGRTLESERWRGNIWLEGPAPWEEFEWIGKRLRIGSAVVEISEPIRRCKHTMSNPRTGKRDADTLGVLNECFGHQNFGVYATVVESGRVAMGDAYQVL